MTKARSNNRRSAVVNPGWNAPLAISSLELADIYLKQNPMPLRIVRAFRLIKAGRTSCMKWLPSPDEFIDEKGLFDDVRTFYALFTKLPLSGDVDRRQVALRAFWKNEERLESHSYQPLRDSVEVDEIRGIIRSVIGEFTLSKYRRILSRARPGPGLSIGTRDRRRTAPVFKYLDTDWTCTPAAAAIARDWFLLNPKLLGTLPRADGKIGINTTTSSRMTFVPKNAKTMRTIAIEPSFNVMIQLGTHEYLADRLKKFGIDITDQTLNQRLARVGSLRSGFDSLGTLDLSMASDSITLELLELLLPETWVDFLDSVRTPQTVVDGSVITPKRFCSMGNGFTFALETLVFFAIAEVARRRTGGSIVSIYGDDIIVDTKSCPLAVELLEMSGFVINHDKSYLYGPFRESCGADWYLGEDITPLYLRKQAVRVRDAFRVINRTRFDPRFTVVRDLLLRELSRTGRLIFGIENEDDSSCVFTTFAYAKGSGQVRYNKHYQSWEHRILIESGVDFSEGVYSYPSALLSGSRATPKRGSTMLVLRWRTV